MSVRSDGINAMFAMSWVDAVNPGCERLDGVNARWLVTALRFDGTLWV